MKKNVLAWLLFLVLILLTCGCGTNQAAEETFAEETSHEEIPGNSTDTEQSTEMSENSGQIQDTELEIDEMTKEELTTQLLMENQLDLSVVGNIKKTKGCTFSLPDGFEEVEDIPGMYVTKRYPIDASTIYYVEVDGDISLQLLTEDTFLRQMQSDLKENYDLDIEIDLKSFEKITIGGYPAFRILCSYTIDGIEITHLEYTVNADRSYIITYSQTNEYDRMDEFEASAATIQLEY